MSMHHYRRAKIKNKAARHSGEPIICITESQNNGTLFVTHIAIRREQTVIEGVWE